jgi:TrmH family RNA methyltransferase
MSLDHIQVVLSHPSEPRNIGAACRAMKNAGISRLVIVTDRRIDFRAAEPLAVGAGDVLQNARVLSDLREALADSALAAGLTRRVGQRRKPVSFSPRQLAGKMVRAQGTVSAVFGNEQAGLSDSELQLCHMAVGIPTSPGLPSLNLSHAVQVVAYELYLADLEKTGISTHTPIDSATLNTRVAEIVQSIERLGFHTQPGPQGMPAFLTDILGRAMLSEVEAERLCALFGKLEGMHGR